MGRLRGIDLGGVGLGIVCALDNSGDGATKVPVNAAVMFSRNLNRSKPIPVNYSEEEEYTVVTCHGPKESYTKVYNNNGVEEHVRKFHDHRPQSSSIKISKRATVLFHISPAKTVDFPDIFPRLDFLSSCNMCQKNLHGQDVYMYRAEKAYCSSECRYKQIVIDERKEKHCSKEASKKQQVADVYSSSSPYANGQNIFTTGILAS